MKLLIRIVIPLIVLFSTVAIFAKSADGNGQPGDPIVGGRIYDNWVTALDLEVPKGSQPLWGEQSNSFRSGEITWRCKECHGWDYKGKDGAYGPASIRYTGFSGVSGSIGDSQEEVLAWLDGSNNPDHNFLALTGPNALNDLAAFLRTMQIDAALIIDYESGVALGNNGAGKDLYEEACLDCHGNTGRTIDFSASGIPLYVADIAVIDPWRSLHKIRFGIATDNMTGAESADWSLRNIADVLAYSQSLTRGNPDYSISRNIPDELDIDRQGEIEPIIWASMAILIVIIIGNFWEYIENKAKH